MNNDFLNNSKIRCNERLMQTERLFVSQKQTWFNAFSEHFQSLCAELLKSLYARKIAEPDKQIILTPQDIALLGEFEYNDYKEVCSAKFKEINIIYEF